MTEILPLKKVQIDYTNWRGERAVRLIIPNSIRWGKTEWHPESQWLLSAWSEGKQEMREFAMKDIHSWRPVE